MDFGPPNAEIGQKMANDQLLCIPSTACTRHLTTTLTYSQGLLSKFVK